MNIDKTIEEFQQHLGYFQCLSDLKDAYPENEDVKKFINEKKKIKLEAIAEGTANVIKSL